MKSSAVRVDLASVRCFENTKTFCHELLRALSLQGDRLPLEHYCHRGGWPLEIVMTRIKVITNEEEKMDLAVFVSFTETGAACCSGDVFEHRYFIELPLVINKEDWSGTFSVPQS